MSRRGHVLYLVMMVLAASVVVGASFAARHSVVIDARKNDTVRTQALWLARSGCALSSVPRSVKTPAGAAELTRVGGSVRVVLQGSIATADCTTHEERFTVAGF